MRGRKCQQRNIQKRVPSKHVFLKIQCHLFLSLSLSYSRKTGFNTAYSSSATRKCVFLKHLYQDDPYPLLKAHLTHTHTLTFSTTFDWTKQTYPCFTICAYSNHVRLYKDQKFIGIPFDMSRFWGSFFFL